jgi:hypothetical protein
MAQALTMVAESAVFLLVGFLCAGLRARVCVIIVPCVIEMLTMKKPSLSTSPWRMIHFPALTVTSLSIRTNFRLCPPTSMFAKNLKVLIIWRNEYTRGIRCERGE